MGASEQGAYGIPKKIGLRLKNADNANNHRKFGHPFFKLTLIFHGVGVFRLACLCRGGYTVAGRKNHYPKPPVTRHVPSSQSAGKYHSEKLT